MRGKEAKFPLLNQRDFKKLQEAIYYMKVEELKKACNLLTIEVSGKKGKIIDAILSFVKTGKISKSSKTPEPSKAKKGVDYPLLPKILMLKGAYKNDLRTRLFFKKLVGKHFHFTAFGIDWLNERWDEGRPPTYAEFAQFWQREHLLRKNKQNKLKEEWAYLSFLRRYAEEKPDAAREDAINEWEKVRFKNANVAKRLLTKALKKLS